MKREDVETWMAYDAEDCGFQMLNDNETVTSVQEQSDPVDDETDEDQGSNNNKSSKGPSNADAFSVLETAMEWQKRLDFANEHINEPPQFWEKVLFSDESKFCIFGIKGRKLVWRKQGTAFEKENIVPTVKYGGGGVMVWGCMAANGVGRLTFID
ncbi:transposable element Tc1 transposase [Trichonephila clavipes]|nr:transposable element Tc1 transposase [Trichonephila clavipes]